MAHEQFNTPEWEEAQRLEEEEYTSMIAWQFDEEVKYQAAVATSYPRDASAIFAMNWLKQQGVFI